MFQYCSNIFQTLQQCRCKFRCYNIKYGIRGIKEKEVKEYNKTVPDLKKTVPNKKVKIMSY